MMLFSACPRTVPPLCVRCWASRARSNCVPGARATLLPATVREVAAAADPATRTFLVKADIGATALRLGQTASVLIAAPAVAGVIKLPMSAVFQQGGQSQVWRVDSAKMTVHAQPVAVVGAAGNLVVIAAGLAAERVVVTAGVHVLTEGQKVRAYVEPGVVPRAPATPVSGGPAPAPATTVLASSAAPNAPAVLR